MSNKFFTRDEAYLAMMSGNKVKHKSFTDGEYLYVDNLLTVRDESGYNFKGGWDMRRGGFWDTGWSIYEPK